MGASMVKWFSCTFIYFECFWVVLQPYEHETMYPLVCVEPMERQTPWGLSQVDEMFCSLMLK